VPGSTVRRLHGRVFSADGPGSGQGSLGGQQAVESVLDERSRRHRGPRESSGSVFWRAPVGDTLAVCSSQCAGPERRPRLSNHNSINQLSNSSLPTRIYPYSVWPGSGLCSTQTFLSRLCPRWPRTPRCRI
jgi:hypothetical protein